MSADKTEIDKKAKNAIIQSVSDYYITSSRKIYSSSKTTFDY